MLKINCKLNKKKLMNFKKLLKNKPKEKLNNKLISNNKDHNNRIVKKNSDHNNDSFKIKLK